MTPPRADASSSEPSRVSADQRIARLEAEIQALKAEKERLFAEERGLRDREDPSRRVSFAQEIFQLQHDQRRIEVDILAVEQKVRRLRLGYSEDAASAPDPSGGFAF